MPVILPAIESKGTAFGRTWIRPCADTPFEIVEAAVQAGALLDISVSPAYWGGRFRGTDVPFAAAVGSDLKNALTEAQAATMIEGEMISIFSAIGAETIDTLILRVADDLAAFQRMGALNALAFAKQDGQVKHVGLDFSRGPLSLDWVPYVGSGVDLILYGSNDPALVAFAEKRSIELLQLERPEATS